MNFLSFRSRVGPLKIKSIRELAPGFKPKWIRILFRLFAMGIVSMLIVFAGIALESRWVPWVGLAGILGVAIAIFAIKTLPVIMAFVGFWWPWMGLKAAELDSWLERDLEWGN
jgi:hypothetical protein